MTWNTSVVLQSTGQPDHRGYTYVCDDLVTPDANTGLIPPNCTHYQGLEVVHHGAIWTPAVIQRIVMLSVIMSLTLVGNVIIIVVLTCSKYRKLNSRVNIFIVNLAVGDLTVCCFTMTTEILFVVFEGAWVLGAVACKLLLYVQMITLASTTFILTAMSFDRYMAICRPLSLGTTNSRARRMIAISWIMALIFTSPQLLIFKQREVGIYLDGDIMYKCQSKGYTAWWQRKLYFTFLATYILVIPGILISFCYINVVRVVWQQGRTHKSGVNLRRTVGDKKAIPRAKVKTIKMTLSIICSFIMCWTPYFVVHLIHIWSEYKYEIPESVYVFAETMALLNSALNPILYGCFNIKLKRGLFEVFCPQRIRDRPRNGCGHVTEFVSLADNSHCTDMAKRLTNKCVSQQASTSSSSSQNVNKGEDPNNGTAPPGSKSPRTKDTIITEENKNGFRLRVRFTNESGGTPREKRSLLTTQNDKGEIISSI